MLGSDAAKTHLRARIVIGIFGFVLSGDGQETFEDGFGQIVGLDASLAAGIDEVLV